MKDQLLRLLSKVIALLEECGWPDKAEWFARVKESITESQSETELQDILRKLDKVISGMGSFDDLPLTPKSGTRSVQEARELQWNLVQELGEAIDRLRTR